MKNQQEPGPLAYLEKFDAQMWSTQWGWGPITKEDVEAIHNALPVLRKIMADREALAKTLQGMLALHGPVSTVAESVKAMQAALAALKAAGLKEA